MTSIAPVSQQILGYEVPSEDCGRRAIDRTIEESWQRVAHALAEVEKDQDAWAGKFYSALADFRYLPAGRIFAGAGTGRPGYPLQLFRYGNGSGQHGRNL